MLNYKKVLLIAASIIFTATIGFSSGSQESSDSGEKEITLRSLDYFSTGDQCYPVFSRFLADYEAENPNVTIEHEGLESSDCRTKMAVEMASGNPAEINYMVQSLGKEYSQQGLLMDLKPYIDADPEWKAYYSPAALDAMTWDGKIYLVPGFAHYGGLFYNIDVLKEAGFDGPAKTWDELIEQSKALKAIGKTAFMTNGKQFRYAWFISQLMVRTMGADNMAKCYAGEMDWDDPNSGFIETLSYLEELVAAGAFPKDVNGLDTAVAQMLFGDGEAAYWYEGTWLVSQFATNISEEFRDSLSWTTFPTIAGASGDQNGGVGGPLLGWGLSSKVTDQDSIDAMLAFVKKVMDTEQGSAYLSENAQASGTIATEEASKAVHPLFKQVIDTYNTLDIVAYPTDVASPSPVDNAIKKIVVPAIISGTMSAEEGATLVQEKAAEFWAE